MNSELLEHLIASAKIAVKRLEQEGYTFIYADEDEKQRRRELRSIGITKKIKVLPWMKEANPQNL